MSKEKYDIDYADDVKMYELVKYDEEGEVWNCTGIYAEDWNKAKLMLNTFNKGE